MYNFICLKDLFLKEIKEIFLLVSTRYLYLITFLMFMMFQYLRLDFNEGTFSLTIVFRTIHFSELYIHGKTYFRCCTKSIRIFLTPISIDYLMNSKIFLQLINVSLYIHAAMICHILGICQFYK